MKSGKEGRKCDALLAIGPRVEKDENAHCGVLHASPPCMKQPPELVGRAYRFSLAALRFYRKLPKSPDAQVPGVQFLKAATSTWSNYRASQRGRSRAEFIAKLGTATEESDEVSWLAGIHERRRHRFRRSAPGRSERDLRNVDGVSNKRPTQLDVRPPFYFSLFTFYFYFYFLLSYFISPASMRVRSLFCSVGSGHVVYGLYAHGGLTVLLKSRINLPLTGASA